MLLIPEKLIIPRIENRRVGLCSIPLCQNTICSSNTGLTMMHIKLILYFSIEKWSFPVLAWLLLDTTEAWSPAQRSCLGAELFFPVPVKSWAAPTCSSARKSSFTSFIVSSFSSWALGLSSSLGHCCAEPHWTMAVHWSSPTGGISVGWKGDCRSAGNQLSYLGFKQNPVCSVTQPAQWKWGSLAYFLVIDIWFSRILHKAVCVLEETSKLLMSMSTAVASFWQIINGSHH